MLIREIYIICIRYFHKEFYSEIIILSCSLFKVLADIAWTEPRTFRSLVDIARMEIAKDPASFLTSPENVIDSQNSTEDPHKSMS